MTQLTKNFKLEEFAKNKSCNQYQISLLKILANELQSVRDNLNLHDEFKRDAKKQISMNITSGVRSQEDYDRLIKNGYNPSKTSDHFCGLQILSKPTLGAADITFNNLKISYLDLHNFIKKLNEDGVISFGQIILEYNPSKKSYWIHFGNDPKLIFREEVASSISRKKYLISMDNGKTYKDA